MKVDILAIGVHPDDVELSCSGTLLKHIADGKSVGILDLTLGELGTRGNAKIRTKEAMQAAKIMGVKFRDQMNLSDGFFANDEMTQKKIIEKIRLYKPEIVLCNAISDRHPDHGRAAKLVADSCFYSGLIKISKTNEVRGLMMKVDYLPAPHGSALFCRGETQSLTTVTLGTKQDEQMLDKSSGLEYSKFLLHYNFPPFSTGEAKPMRGTGRREIGHGNLAMRSLKQVLPPQEDNLYTIRIVSDILESNGSSSMATVCAGSLALMDAGIQVKSGVSGIAMGLISEGNRIAVIVRYFGR